MTQDTILHSRHADGGPLYTETDLSKYVAEPWNGISALLFLMLAIYWAWKTRDRKSLVLNATFLVLAIGGVGGSLFHAFRSSMLFYAMDVVPIALLCCGWSLYLWQSITPHYRRLGWVFAIALGIQKTVSGVWNRQMAITIDYGILALCILSPFAYSWRSLPKKARRHFLSATALFLVAAGFRAADPYSAGIVARGTHWLWHTFSAIAVHQFIASLVQWKFQPANTTKSAGAVPSESSPLKKIS